VYMYSTLKAHWLVVLTCLNGVQMFALVVCTETGCLWRPVLRFMLYMSILRELLVV